MIGMGKKIIKMFKNEKGLTLMEVLISIVILSLLAMTFFNVFLNAFDNSIKAQEVTNYTYATQAKIEELRSLTLADLITGSIEQEGNAPFDINGDGVDDCFMHYRVSPQGIVIGEAAASQIKDPVFVYLLYIGDKVLVLAQNGDTLLYTDAGVNPTIVLDLTPGAEGCSVTVNGQSVYFDRKDSETNVLLSAFLNYKDFGYNSYVQVNAPSGLVYSSAYGSEDILSEFSAGQHTTEHSGIMNSVPFMFKIDVELFHEEDDTVAFYDMTTLIDVSFADIRALADTLE